MGEAAQKSWSGARVVWAAPDAHCTDVLCRSCGVLGPKPPLLFAAVWETPARRRSVALVACPACGCAFAPEPESVAYEIEDEDHEATTDFYVQAGAGLWPIIRPLTRQRTPPGSRYLEVGCGYGFGLDYAIRACGLEGVGIDPSPAAARGREELGLPIELRYLSSEDATAVRADLVFASEVLEHVDDPLFLLRMLRAALAPTGLLIVTTPDRAALVPDRPPSDFLHVLSIGHHITLQTEASLGVLLHRAGFDHVRTEAADDQLVAFASMEPLLLTEAPAESRRRFRDHLRSRVAELTSATSLFWGFAGRAYQEAVIDGAWDEAAALWTRLRAACEERFSFNIDAPEDYPDLQACSVSELAERIPLALPNLLYARVLQKVKHGGETITNVLPLLRQVAELGVSLISALRARGVEDQAILGVTREAQRTSAAAASDAGARDSLDLLQKAISQDPRSAIPLTRRSFVGLVNAGAFADAQTIVNTGGLEVGDVPIDGQLAPFERDLVYALGMLDLQDPERLDSALHRLDRVRRQLAPGDQAWACVRGRHLAAERLGRPGLAAQILAAETRELLPRDLQEHLAPLPNSAKIS